MTQPIEGFRTELESLINKHSKENNSNTPDFILATYLNDCLIAFDSATVARDEWHGNGSLSFRGKKGNKK